MQRAVSSQSSAVNGSDGSSAWERDLPMDGSFTAAVRQDRVDVASKVSGESELGVRSRIHLLDRGIFLYFGCLP
jgi:hypothetical protein